MVLTGGPIIKVGHFEADGAEVDLDLGFVPDYFKCINANAAAGEKTILEWWGDMPVGDGFEWNKLTDNGTTALDNINWVTTGHYITALDEAVIDVGTENDDADPVRVEAKKGVTIDAAYMDASDEVWYIAFGNANQKDHGAINA